MTITICIGSSCHLKGSRTIIQKLEEAGYCRVVGEKMSEAAGRPTRLIELKKI